MGLGTVVRAIALALGLGVLAVSAGPSSASHGAHRVLLPHLPRDAPEIETTLVEEFGDPASGWPNRDRTTVAYRYSSGEYQVLVGSGVFAAGAANDVVTRWRRFTAAVDARLAGAHERRAVGLAFGIPDPSWSRFHACLVGDGAAGFWRGGPGFLDPVEPPRASAAVHAGRAVNRIRVDARGTTAECYVNDALVATATGLAAVEGEVGVVVRISGGATDADTRFDNLVVTGVKVVPTPTPTPSPTPGPVVWTERAPMPDGGRFSHGVAAVGGKVYAVGGGQWGSDAAYEYDPATDAWRSLPPLPTARSRVGVAALGGLVYVVGGWSLGDENCVGTTEAYDPAAGAWRRLAAKARTDCDAKVAAAGGRLYAFGGNFLRTVEEYDPATDAWRALPEMPTGRASYAVAAVEHRIYVVGGHEGPGWSTATRTNRVEEYNTVLGTWLTRRSMPVPSVALAAVAVSGKVYALGGAAGDTYSSYFERRLVQEYSPGTDTWVRRGNMLYEHQTFGAAAVGNRIYAVGGWNGRNGSTDYGRVEEGIP